MEFTQDAISKLKEIIQIQKAEGVRIFQAAEGCCGPQIGFSLDPAMEQDERIEQDGIQIAIDPVVSGVIQELLIDYVIEPDNEGFVMIGGPTGSC